MSAKYVIALSAGPAYAIRPSERTISWSNVSYTSLLGWWMVAKTHMFRVVESSLMKFMMLRAAAASSPEVGSSRNRSAGSLMTAVARLRRRRCPPLSPAMNWLPTLVSAHPESPMRSISLSTCAARSAALLVLYRSDAYCTVSLHVRNAHCWSACVTTAACLLKAFSESVTPLSVRFPVRVPGPGTSVSTLSSIVFPAPDGPMTASTSPLFTTPLIPLRICLSPLEVGTVYLMLSKRNTWEACVTSTATDGMMETTNK